MYKKGSHLYLLVQTTTKHRKQATTVQMPLPPRRIYIDQTKKTAAAKSHHQISTRNLPAHTQSNFVIIFNTQHKKYHI
jgi:hypothetical protein